VARLRNKLGCDYRLEREADVLILRRRDGSFVTPFSARGATEEGVLRAAEEDERGHPHYLGPEKHARAARRWVEARMGSAWEAFVRTERLLLGARRNGQLAKALGSRLPLESREELDKMAYLDRRLAEHELLELRSEEGVLRFRHIEDLSPEDREERVRAELRRLEWLMRRHERRAEGAARIRSGPRRSETGGGRGEE
jgi:hypothetical protein